MAKVENTRCVDISLAKVVWPHINVRTFKVQICWYNGL